MKRALLLHPFLIAAAPILFEYQHNADQVEPGAVLAFLAAALAAAACVYGLWWLLLRDALRAAACCSLTLVLFFTYGHLFDLALLGLGAAEVAPRFALIHAVLGGTYALLFGTLVWRIVRTRRDLNGLSSALFISAAAMVAMSVFGLASGNAFDPRAHGADASRTLLAGERAACVKQAPAPQDDALRPDIYYIILDGYAREDVLARVYGFDNGSFIRSLEGRGFYVARESCANYPMTFLSLASTLNMRYLDDVADALGRKRKTRAPFYDMIHDPLVGRFLQARGYRYVHFNTNYGGTETSDIADTQLAYRPAWQQGEFASVLLRTTALRIVEPQVATLHTFMLDQLLEIPKIDGPTFAFCHLLLPHNPYVFDRDGNVRHDIPLDLQFKVKTGGWDDKQAYLDQMTFVNRRMLAIVDHIVAHSAHPPVIIIQSDHGSAATYPGGDATGDALLPFARERVPILNAYLVPPAMRARLYPSITPVNTFRVLFDTCFGATFGLLPDESFLCWYGKPYQWTNVTSAVARPPTAMQGHIDAGSAAKATGDVIEAGAKR